MSLLETIKANSRAISDAFAGTPAYFELATTNLSLARAVREAVEEAVQGRALDAGAGRQAYRGIIARRAASYESLDRDAALDPDHVGDAEDIPLPDASFDAVVCTQVIQHTPQPWRAVAEMARVLRPGGRLVLTAPHLVWLHNEPYDYFRFTPHGLRHMAEQAGLVVERVEPVGGWVCFLAYGPSNAALSLAWGLGRWAFNAALLANRLAIRVALLADRVVGMKGLYPANVLMVARKP